MLLKRKVFLLIFVLLLTSREYVTAQSNSAVPVGLSTILVVGGSSISLLLMYLQALRENDRIQNECAKTSSTNDACAKKLAEAAVDLKKAKTDSDEQLRQKDAEKTAALVAQQQKCNDEKTVLTEDKNKSAVDLKKAKTDCDEQLRQKDAEKTAALGAQQQKCNDEKTVLTEDKNKSAFDLKKAKTDSDEQLRQKDAEKTAALVAQQQKCNDEKTVLTEDKNKSADDLKKAKTDCDEQLRQKDAEKTAALGAQQQKCNDEKTVLTEDKNKLSAELEQAKKEFAKTIAENDAKFHTQLASEKAKCDAAIKKCENEKTTLSTAKTKCDNDLAVCQSKAMCSLYPGYEYDSPTRVCYKAITRGFKQKADAVAECNSNSGGRPIKVDNAQIQNLAKSVLASKSMIATWIDGVRQGPSSPVWKDTNNNDLTFFDWYVGQPGSKCCFVAMAPSGKMIAGRGGGSAVPVICEVILN